MVSTESVSVGDGRRRAVLPFSAIVGLITVASVPLDAATHQLSFSNTGWSLLVTLPFLAVGFLVARRQPENPIGWLLLVFVALVAVGGCAGPYALLAYRYGHPGLPLRLVAASLATVLAALPLAILPLPILLFPDGRATGRWRWVMRASLAGVAALGLGMTLGCIAAALGHHVNVDSSGELTSVQNASGPLAPIAAVVGVFLALDLGVVCVLAISRQLLALRRARGEQRQQLKWLIVGAGASSAAIVFFATGAGSGTSALDTVLSSLAGLLLAAFPVCMGVAILRYRLYEIDRLISRTLSYAILTGLLAGAFIGIVTLSTDVLPFSSRVGVAASTLVAVALFNPLRVRVQRLVDRRFNRARYDAQATVTAFTARLRDAVELDAVRGELLAVVRDAVEPSHVSVWLR
jgi:MFS family permease